MSPSAEVLFQIPDGFRHAHSSIDSPLNPVSSILRLALAPASWAAPRAIALSNSTAMSFMAERVFCEAVVAAIVEKCKAMSSSNHLEANMRLIYTV